MAKLRIGVLYDYWWDEDEDRSSEDSRPKRKSPEEDVQEVYDALKEIGHNPVFLRLDGTRQALQEVAESETDLIFNLVESFGGQDGYDTNVAAFLELIGRRFTGAGSRGLYLAQDKALAKKIFAFHGIHTPYFTTVYRGRTEHSHDIQFPVIVKPAGEDGSVGIAFGAVCGSIKELMDRIDYIHAQFDCPALIEEYIEGRELYVGVLGERRARSAARDRAGPLEAARGRPQDRRQRGEVGGRHRGVREDQVHLPRRSRRGARRVDQQGRGSGVPERSSSATTGASTSAWRPTARCTCSRSIRIPYLLSTSELAMAAKKAGRPYKDLIGEIVDLALARYGEPAGKNGNGRGIRSFWGRPR